MIVAIAAGNPGHTIGKTKTRKQEQKDNVTLKSKHNCGNIPQLSDSSLP